MAAYVVREDIVQQFFDRYFDSDSEEEYFDGFDGGEIEEAIRHARVVRGIKLDRPNGDVDRPGIARITGEDGDLPLTAPFTGTPGLLVDLESRQPLDFFNLLFIGEMWDTLPLVQETNRYAEQRLEDEQFSR